MKHTHAQPLILSISYRQLAAQAKEKDKDIETAIESQVSLGMMVELLIQGWNFFEEGIHCCQFSLSLSFSANPEAVL